MPDKFLRLFGVVSSFPVGLHQDANPFNDFQRRQLYWKSTKNTLYLTETLQYCRKTILWGLKRSGFQSQLCHFKTTASASASHLILLGLSILNSKITEVK